MIGQDGRITEEAGELRRDDRGRGAGGGRRRPARARAGCAAEEPYTHSVPFSHRSGERIEPLISLQWFCRMDELAQPAIEVGRTRRGADRAGAVEARLPRTGCGRSAPGASRASSGGATGSRSGTATPARRRSSPRSAPERCGSCGGELRQEEDVLDTWFSSALWPFATLGWPDDTPELRAFYPTSFLTTAREILFLWVARMVMTGIEFAGDVPFRDVYVHSVIQARDGRRMSKSLGTGIDPLEEIDVHGADALRFGLLAMSSTQDVRFSDAKVEQGRDLANKLWNATRLILLNAAEVEPAPRPLHVEDRWILSRLERTIASVTEKLEAYDFAHAVQEAYSLLLARPLRLVPGDRQAAPLRRRGGGLGDAALRARAGARPAAPDDAVRHRGDLVLPPGPPRPPRRPRLPGGRRVALRRGRRGRRRGRDRAHPAPARLARPRRRPGRRRCWWR